MNIDWVHFSPWTSLAGGALIGLAAVALMALLGRVAGISGVLGGLLASLKARMRNGLPTGMQREMKDGHTAWRAAFVLGLMAAPWVHGLWRPAPWPEVQAGPALLVAAGLLVGYGTRMGSGCTSGHGVCGLSRGSLRSAVATAGFMAAGFATVAAVRHLLPWLTGGA